MCDVTSQAPHARLSRRTAIAAAVLGGTTAATASGGQAAAMPSRGKHGPSPEGCRTRLVLLGTAGGPPWYAGTTRAGIASALVVGDRYYLIDAGHGVGQRLRAAELGAHDRPLSRLRAVFLTHLHSDHVIDLNNVLVEGVANGLEQVDRPVQIWGPGNRGAVPPLFGPPPAPPVTAPENPTPGTAETVGLLVRAFATDINDRSFDNRLPTPDRLYSGHDVPIPAELVDDPNGDPHPRMSPVKFYEDDRVRVSATLVQHAPVFPALAFRFDTDDGSVVFSGDTGPSENLIELAQGADILVHEVIDREWAEEGLFPAPRTPQQDAIVQHLLHAHTQVDQVGPIADAAGVPTLVLSHLVPGDWPEHKWRRAQRGYSGELIVGRDLDTFGVGRRARR